MEWFQECDARILAAAASIGEPLVISFGFERDAEPLNSARVAGLVELYPGNADARVIAPRDESWPRAAPGLRTPSTSCGLPGSGSMIWHRRRN
jgi:hypothetical protein